MTCVDLLNLACEEMYRVMNTDKPPGYTLLKCSKCGTVVGASPGPEKMEIVVFDQCIFCKIKRRVK